MRRNDGRGAGNKGGQEAARTGRSRTAASVFRMLADPTVTTGCRAGGQTDLGGRAPRALVALHCFACREANPFLARPAYKRLGAVVG